MTADNVIHVLFYAQRLRFSSTKITTRSPTSAQLLLSAVAACVDVSLSVLFLFFAAVFRFQSSSCHYCCFPSFCCHHLFGIHCLTVTDCKSVMDNRKSGSESRSISDPRHLLPQLILVQVLQRLPSLQQVAQAGCVSKRWLDASLVVLRDWTDLDIDCRKATSVLLMDTALMRMHRLKRLTVRHVDHLDDQRQQLMVHQLIHKNARSLQELHTDTLHTQLPPRRSFTCLRKLLIKQIAQTIQRLSGMCPLLQHLEADDVPATLIAFLDQDCPHVSHLHVQTAVNSVDPHDIVLQMVKAMKRLQRLSHVHVKITVAGGQRLLTDVQQGTQLFHYENQENLGALTHFSLSLEKGPVFDSDHEIVPQQLDRHIDALVRNHPRLDHVAIIENMGRYWMDHGYFQMTDVSLASLSRLHHLKVLDLPLGSVGLTCDGVIGLLRGSSRSCLQECCLSYEGDIVCVQQELDQLASERGPSLEAEIMLADRYHGRRLVHDMIML